MKSRPPPPQRVARLTDPPNRLIFTLLLFSLASGAAYLTGLSAPPAIDLNLGPGWRVLWALMLTVGAGLGIGSMYWPRAPADEIGRPLMDGHRMWRPVIGARIYRAGLVLAAGGALGYGSLVTVANGPTGVQAGLASVAIGSCYLVRAWQIGRLVGETERHAQEDQPSE